MTASSSHEPCRNAPYPCDMQGYGAFQRQTYLATYYPLPELSFTDRENAAVSCIKRPLNLPRFPIHFVKKNEVIDILSWIEFKTAIHFFHICNKWIRIQDAFKTLIIITYAKLHLPDLPCLRVKFKKRPDILRWKELEPCHITSFYKLLLFLFLR